MIGIVVVSHSALIAEGVVTLARQMGGDVAIAAAGGIDDPDDPIGTDPVRVLAAIEEVWSDDGVVVLMDLGSALLSADFALDMLDEDRRGRVVLSDAPLVEGAVAAATIAGAGGSLDDVVTEARSALGPKSSGLDLPPLGGDGAPVVDPVVAHPPAGAPGAVTAVLPVGNRTGLHARPAARFVGTVAAHDATVTVTNITTGTGPVRGDSFSAIGTLGARQGHHIEVTASGPEAAAVLDSLRDLADKGYGDGVDEEDPGDGPPPGGGGTVDPGEGRPPAAGPFGASPGTAMGPVRHLIRPELPENDPLPVGDPSAERSRLAAALRHARIDIERSRTVTRSVTGEAEAAIFDAHLMLLGDAELIEQVEDGIDTDIGAVASWTSAIEAIAARFRDLDDAYQRERAADVEAVGRQVHAALLGIDFVSEPSGTGILVTQDLDPGQTARLDPTTVLGIVTSAGGPTSHTAILARSLGIPAIVAAGPEVLDLAEGVLVLIDGSTGEITIDPDDAAIARAEVALADERTAAAEAVNAAAQPAVTADGVTVPVAANAGSIDDVDVALAAGADGIGLFRTEFLFLDRDRTPSEDEQEEVYRTVASRLGGGGLVLRTLDVGGDKPLSFAPGPSEANPFLGVRGLRFGLRHRSLLATQLAAIVRVAADHPVAVMFPMVTTVAEIIEARAMVDEAIAATGVTPSDGFQVGVMIEVPAAAILADRMAPHVDFFSIGTNDLTQYVMAAERGSAALAHLADPLHPAVLRLIATVAEAGAEHGARVGVCGEAAGDPEAVPLLIGLGVIELSAAAALVPAVKQAVRSITLSRARALAAAVLDLDDAPAVRHQIRHHTPDG